MIKKVYNNGREQMTSDQVTVVFNDQTAKINRQE